MKESQQLVVTGSLNGLFSARSCQSPPVARHPNIQPLDQARARDQFWPDRGDVEFGGQKLSGYRHAPFPWHVIGL